MTGLAGKWRKESCATAIFLPPGPAGRTRPRPRREAFAGSPFSPVEVRFDGLRGKDQRKSLLPAALVACSYAARRSEGSEPRELTRWRTPGFSSALPAPITTHSSGLSATETGSPVSSRSN